MQKFEQDCRVTVDGANLKPSNDKNIIHILHVDDDPTILEISKLLLIDMGNFEIDHARCVDEALKKISNGNYDVVISDYEMPQKDGLQFLKELRAQTNEIPFILFTGKGREEVAIKALNLGADAYINKQGDPETVYAELSHTIAKATERKNSIRRLAESEAKYLRLFNSAEVGMFRTRLHSSEILDINEKLLQILGYSREEMQGTPATVYHKDAAEREKLVKVLQAMGQLVDVEIKLVSKQGGIKNCLLSAKIYTEEEIVEGSIIDITERKNAELALALSEKTLRAYLESSPVSVFVADNEAKYEYVNDAACTMLGYSREELLNMTTDQAVPKEDNYSRSRFNKLKEKGYFAGEMRLRKKDGTIIDVSLHSNKLPDGKLVASCEDITERKKAKEALADSEAKYRALVENAEDVILLTDLTGKQIYRNPAYYKSLGFEETDQLDLTEFARVHPEDLPALKEKLVEILRKGSGTFDYRIKHRNGSWNYRSTKLTVIYNIKNQPYAILLIIRDITERKKAEDVLLAKERELSSIYSSVPEVLFSLSVESESQFRFISVSQSFLDTTGLTENQVVGKSVQEVIPEPSLTLVLEKYKQAIRERRTVRWEEITDYPSGRKYGKVGVNPVFDSNGCCTNLIGSVHDNTESKKAEQALIESEERFRKAFSTSPDAFMLTTLKESLIVECNDAFLEMFGFTRQEVVGKRALELNIWADPLDRERIALLLKKDGKVRNIESVYRRKNGEIFPVLGSATLLQANNQVLILVTARDTSISKRAESDLKESEANYRALINGMDESAWVIDFDGNFIDVNTAASKTLGYSKEELLTMGLKDIDKSFSKEQFEDHLRAMPAAATKVFESVHSAKDGTEIPVEISSSLITYRGKQARLSIARNITERKEIEMNLKESRHKLELMNEKLCVVGCLTRHDVRNKLSAVNGYAYLLKKKHADQADIAEGLSKIELAVKDSVKIFEFAKMYEQLGVEELSYVDVGKAVDEALALFSGLTIKVVNDCHGVRVLADSFLRQMFYNFIDNTRKYGEKATIIKVRCEQEKSGGLILVYEDDGIGIQAENKPKLFTEGFSTRSNTGLGLFFIKKMMGIYGWVIAEEGEPDQGAKFTIAIPKKNKNEQENQQSVQ